MKVTGGFKLVREGKPTQSFFSCFLPPFFRCVHVHVVGLRSHPRHPLSRHVAKRRLAASHKFIVALRGHGEKGTQVQDTNATLRSTWLAPRSFRLQVRNIVSVSPTTPSGKPCGRDTRVCACAALVLGETRLGLLLAWSKLLTHGTVTVTVNVEVWSVTCPIWFGRL